MKAALVQGFPPLVQGFKRSLQGGATKWRPQQTPCNLTRKAYNLVYIAHVSRFEIKNSNTLSIYVDACLL